MKSVLISIQPKWCELIANGSKTIEVRKTKPKLDKPFKVYVYCTKPRNHYRVSSFLYVSDENLYLAKGKVRMGDGFDLWAEGVEYEFLNGKVIGEFMCDTMTYAKCGEYCILPKSKTQIDELDLLDYADGKPLYGWHISNLVIYDKPRELGEFRKECKLECDMQSLDNPPCEKCEHLVASFGCSRTITRPPQSWCYVESLGDAQ